MSHLDTAYSLGVKQAEADFNAELQKAAQGNTLQPSVPPSTNNVSKSIPVEQPKVPILTGVQGAGALPGRTPSTPPPVAAR
jgi:hypothetical protein